MADGLLSGTTVERGITHQSRCNTSLFIIIRRAAASAAEDSRTGHLSELAADVSHPLSRLEVRGELLHRRRELFQLGLLEGRAQPGVIRAI